MLFLCFILIVIVGWDLKSSHDPGRYGRLDWKHQNCTRMLRQGWQKWISSLCVPLINVFFFLLLSLLLLLTSYFFFKDITFRTESLPVLGRDSGKGSGAISQE